jgi:tripartite-type tricarboxylate transporter receptor subunit TctC
MNLRFAFLAAALCAAGQALAQAAYPTKPIRFLLGSGPGGLADVTTRLFGQKLGERLGQAVVVENRPSAGGVIATQTVAGSPPDGHTLMVMVSGNAISKSLLKSLPYDLEKDFIPVTSVAFFDLLVLVKTDSPHKTVNDLLNAPRAKQAGINIGSTSTGSVQNLTSHLFASTTQVKNTIITYKTSGDMLGALLRGDVDIAIDAYTSLKGAIDARQIRALASSGPTRSRLHPNVPTMKESGFPDFEVIGWNSIFAPAGTPAAVISMLNRNIVEIVALPEIQKRFLEIGAEPRTSTPEEMAAFFKRDIQKFEAVIKRAGIERQ